MAYIFDLEKDFDDEPYVAADGSRIIDFALGYDPDSSLIVLMSVMLILDESGAYELCFGIRPYSDEVCSVRTTNSVHPPLVGEGRRRANEVSEGDGVG